MMAVDFAAIYLMIDKRGLKAARAEYHKQVGIEYSDQQIEAEIEQRFADWLGEPGPLRLPARLVLALILREGFNGRGRGHSKSPLRKIEDARAMKRYKKLRARHSAPEAAKLVSDKSKLSVAAILDGRPNRSRAKSRKQPEAE